MGFLENVGITSEIIPNAGSTKIYTSGWPKIQNRCCHNNGSPPNSGVKKVAPNNRLKVSKKSATAITGIAKTKSNCTTNIIQVKTGILKRVIPGARMLKIVTVRLIPETSEAMPVICNPRA